MRQSDRARLWAAYNGHNPARKLPDDEQPPEDAEDTFDVALQDEHTGAAFVEDPFEAKEQGAGPASAHANDCE